jgi:hypothetical protein
MPLRALNDAKHWRNRAAELRMLADSYLDNKAAAILLRWADDYEKKAKRAADVAMNLPGSSALTREQLQ